MLFNHFIVNSYLR